MSLADLIIKTIEDALEVFQLPGSRITGQVPGGKVAPATGDDPGAVQLSDATPASVGSATAGTAGTVSRSDHVHAHGSQGGGSQHAAATTSTAGFVVLAPDGGTTAGTVVQANDSRLGSATLALDGLTDVQTAGEAAGVGLWYDGTVWRPGYSPEPLLLEDGTIAVLESGRAAMSEPTYI